MRGAGEEQEETEQTCFLPSPAFPPPIKAQRGELARAGSKQLILATSTSCCCFSYYFYSFSAERRRKLAAAGVAGNLPIVNNSNVKMSSFKHIVSSNVLATWIDWFVQDGIIC